MNHDYDIVQQPFDLAFFSVSAIRAALVNTSWIFIFSNAEHSITSCADTCVPTFLPSSKLKYFLEKRISNSRDPRTKWFGSQDQVVRTELSSPWVRCGLRTKSNWGSWTALDQDHFPRTDHFWTDCLGIPDSINKSNKWVEMSHFSALLIKL